MRRWNIKNKFFRNIYVADSDRTGLTVIPQNIIGNILKMIIWRGIYESGTARIDTSAWQLARNIIISG